MLRWRPHRFRSAFHAELYFLNVVPILAMGTKTVCFPETEYLQMAERMRSDSWPCATPLFPKRPENEVIAMER
jgi:hypothetical protein